jgi:ABC-type sugar transport system substrate-binding protein
MAVVSIFKTVFQEGEKQMKKGKRLVAVLVAVLMVFTLGLAACESGDGGGTTTPAGSGPDTGMNIATELSGKQIYGDDAEDVKIGVIPMSMAGVTSKMTTKALDDITSFFSNITYQTFEAEYNPNNQVTAINECITQGFDAIIIEAADPVLTAPPIEEAEKAGIPVITMNLNSNALHSLHIYGDDYHSGEMAADVLAEAVGGKGVAIGIDGPKAQEQTNRHVAGFKANIEANYPDIQFAEQFFTDNFSKEIAQQNMTSALQKYPDINIVFCMSDDLADGAIQAINAAGKGDQIKVYGAMGYPDALVRIRDGKQFGSFYSDAYIEYQTAFYQALYLIENGITSVTAGYKGTPAINQPTTPITQDNVNTIIEISHWKELDPETFG